MTPNDIQPGKIYKRKTFNGFQYFLGIGKRIMWEDRYKTKEANFSEKNLVCLDNEYEGLVCQLSEDSYEGGWEGFELVPEFKSLEDFYKKKFVDNQPAKP